MLKKEDKADSIGADLDAAVLSLTGSAAAPVAPTTLVLAALRTPHPPAGATTLIVSLGILTNPKKLVSMAAAITAVTALGRGLNIQLGTRPNPEVASP